MSDRRLTPDPARVTGRSPGQIGAVFSDLLRAPEGPRDRQLVHGTAVDVLNDQDGWCYVQAEDGYVGYVRTSSVQAAKQNTHRISSPCTHVYQEPDFKSRDVLALPHNSRIRVTGRHDRFLETDAGFVPVQHASPIEMQETDPVSVAEHYLGTDYLWGGNTRWGIDCSGLVQAACFACAIPCPGDSDQQERALGDLLAEGSALRRNDLLFWKGHVALVSDPHTLIHANAHAMAVVHEPVAQALARIAKTDGPVTAHKRLANR